MNLVKRILFFSALLLLCSPMLLQVSNIQLGKKLKGWQAPPVKDTLNWKNVSTGRWQANIENSVRADLKAKPLLARLNNQMKASLFGQLNAQNVIEGKNGFLFEEAYIRTYLGLDFKGEKSIANNVNQLKLIADSLEANGSHLLFVFASGKASFMPEHFPAPYDTMSKGVSNYETYKKLLTQANVSTLDLNSFLSELKDTSQYNLYTKGGTHWSEYAIGFVTDTLIGKIEAILNTNLPDYSYGPVETTNKPRGTDDDIFQSLNLLWSSIDETYAYRDLQVVTAQASNGYRPKVWAIGDSFYGTLMDAYIPHRFFDPNSLFIYYSLEVRTLDGKTYPFVFEEFEKKRTEAENQDLIIIFITEANIGNCCWGLTGMFSRMYEGG